MAPRVWGIHAAAAVQANYMRSDLPPSANTTSPEDPGLSTGTQAGIGIGAGLAGPLFLAALLFIVYATRRYKQRQRDRRVRVGLRGGTAGGRGRAELEGSLGTHLASDIPPGFVPKCELHGHGSHIAELEVLSPRGRDGGGAGPSSGNIEHGDKRPELGTVHGVK